MSTQNDGFRLVVTSGDHRAFIVVTAAICITWTVLVMIIRCYLRLRMIGPFGLDDTVALIATVVGIIQTSVTLAAVHFGLGKRTSLLTSSQIDHSTKCLYAASILYILAICASKLSMSLLVARLTRTKRHIIASRFLAAFTVIWGIAAAFAVAFQCGIPSPWISVAENDCPSLFIGWAVVEAFSLFIEALICVLSVFLVWDLMMATNLKIIVVAAFTVRILIIIPTTFRLILLRKIVASSDTTFDSTNVVIATQVVLHYSLWAATLPVMRAFLQCFDSGLGATTGLDTGLGSKYENNNSSGSGNSGSALKSTYSGHVKPSRAHESVSFSPEFNSTIATVTARQITGSRKSTESGDSNRAVIKKTQKWEIRHESREEYG